jgi:hypothetical protein
MILKDGILGVFVCLNYGKDLRIGSLIESASKNLRNEILSFINDD